MPQEDAQMIGIVEWVNAASGMANGDGGWMERDHVNLASQEDAQVISIVNRDNSANVESASIRGPSACRISIAEERKSASWEGVYQAALEDAPMIGVVELENAATGEDALNKSLLNASGMKIVKTERIAANRGGVKHAR